MTLFIGRYLVMGGLLLLGLASPALAQDDKDPDGDGLSTAMEIVAYHTDPNNHDTDGDGQSDDAEIRAGYSPLQAGSVKLADIDSDGDGLNDRLEVSLGIDSLRPDTDGDGFRDGDEVYHGYDPLIYGSGRLRNKRVVVDLSDQHLQYFVGDIMIGKMPISSGQRITPTPVGEFAVERKVPVVHYRGVGYDYPGTKWNIQFKPHYYLHGTYWHNNFGRKPMSHGCVNIAYHDVERLYSFLDVGDRVTTVGVTPAGFIR